MVRSSFTDRNLHWVFPLPAIAFVALLMVFPVLYTLFLSFTNWNLTSGAPASLVGVRSYVRVLTEPRFLDALGRTFLFTILAVAVEGVLGVAVALVLNRTFVGKSVAKLLLLLPLVATPVAVGIVFNLFYDPTIGFFNFVLTSLGLPPGLWVSHQKTVLVSLVLVDVWQWTPMITLIVLAGLKSLPNDPYEAAVIDGASPLKIFWYITLPLIRPVLVAALMLRSLDNLKEFDMLYTITQGGPGIASETLYLYSYNVGFNFFKAGYGSALMVVVFLIVLVFNVLMNRLRHETAAL